jgi:murein L,D-transpeptidase YafK
MRLVRVFLLLCVAVLAAGCGSKVRSYDGPEVTRIVVFKEQRQMYLMHHDEVLKRYDISLGFAPAGPKQVEGDGKTPEGAYYIDRRNPNSAFYLSLGISYPNAEDRARAAEMGQKPGGDIFIHGQRERSRFARERGDWTAGCISVTNREMEEIYAMVRTGTRIDLYP